MSQIDGRNLYAEMAELLFPNAVDPKDELASYLSRKSDEYKSHNNNYDGDLGFASWPSIKYWRDGKEIKRIDKLKFFNNVWYDDETAIIIGKPVSAVKARMAVHICSFLGSPISRIKRSDAIYLTEHDDVCLAQSNMARAHQYKEAWDYLGGVYIVYRRKFGETGGNQISRELLQIEASEGHVCARWQYLIDDREMKCFEGVPVIVGGFVWMLLYSEALEGRMRAACIDRRDIGRYPTMPYSTGILLGTTPDRHSVAAGIRVCLQKLPEEMEQKAMAGELSDLNGEPLLRHLGREELNHDHADLIKRVVDNSVEEGGRLEALQSYVDEYNRGLPKKDEPEFCSAYGVSDPRQDSE